MQTSSDQRTTSGTRPRIGYVLKMFPRLSETFILNELLGQQRLGCELTVLSRYRPSEPVPHAALKWLQADVHYMDELLQERFWEPFEIHRRLSKRRPKAHDRALAAALMEALGTHGPILMYTAYEKGVIEDLATLCPDLADGLNALIERLVDLAPIARDNYYHPDMRGAWSLKSIIRKIVL